VGPKPGIDAISAKEDVQSGDYGGCPLHAGRPEEKTSSVAKPAAHAAKGSVLLCRLFNFESGRSSCGAGKGEVTGSRRNKRLAG